MREKELTPGENEAEDKEPSKLEIAASILDGVKEGKYDVRMVDDRRSVQVINPDRGIVALLSTAEFADMCFVWLKSKAGPFFKEEVIALMNDILPGLEQKRYLKKFVDGGRKVIIQDENRQTIFYRDVEFLNDVKYIWTLYQIGRLPLDELFRQSGD